MKPVRTEQRNGYDIRIRTLLVHDTRNAPGAAAPVAGGHAAFVQIAREGEIYVDWHLPRNYKGSVSRDEAEAQAPNYAVRLVEPRPFDGPAPEVFGGGPTPPGQVSRGTQLPRRS